MRTISTGSRLFTLLVAMLFVAAACSDDGDSSSDSDGSADTGVAEEVADGSTTTSAPVVPTTEDLPIGTEEDLRAALAESIASGSGDTTFDEATTQCLVDSIVGGIGYDRLIELGVRPGNVENVDPVLTMSEEEKAAYVDALGACTSLRELVVMTLGFTPPLDQCIDDAIPDDATAGVILLFLLNSTGSTEPPTPQVGEVFDSLEVCRSELLEGPVGD
jgi:hypothetical protein